MKGLVFSELLDLMDQSFGEVTTEKVVAACPLSSGGIYTAVGNYDAQELHLLVSALSKETGLSPDELQRLYGQTLFRRFYDLHPEMFEKHDTPHTFLAAVGSEIHDEVRMLYPDAELPEITVEEHPHDILVVDYRSRRNLGPFCQGLIEGCLQHFGYRAHITAERLAEKPIAHVRFRLELV